MEAWEKWGDGMISRQGRGYLGKHLRVEGRLSLRSKEMAKRWAKGVAKSRSWGIVI